MLKFKLPSRYLLLGILGLSLPISTAITLTSIQPALACRVANPRATLAQRMTKTPIVFRGVVEKVEGDTLTIQVDEYFKNSGSKPRNENLKGFNRTSCDDIITQPGARYLFFAERGKKVWNAVYDLGYGSVRGWNTETANELEELGYVGMQPGSTSPKPPKPTPPIDPDCVPDENAPCPL